MRRWLATSGATARVVAAMVDAVRVPVTVKMRLGWDSSTINAPELARALQDAGAAAVTVHGRTRCQKYEGTADWAQIARVKEAVGVPVFGSGDVEDVETLARRIESGMVDGVVIARGMLGNFWFVRQAVHRLATGTQPPRSRLRRRASRSPGVTSTCSVRTTAKPVRCASAASTSPGRFADAPALRGFGPRSRRWTRASVSTRCSTVRSRPDRDPEGWFRPVFVSGEG